MDEKELLGIDEYNEDNDLTEYDPDVGDVIYEVCRTLGALSDLLRSLSNRQMLGEETTSECFDFLANTANNCKLKLLPYAED